jgi:hypothetical protein
VVFILPAATRAASLWIHAEGTSSVRLRSPDGVSSEIVLDGADRVLWDLPPGPYRLALETTAGDRSADVPLYPGMVTLAEIHPGGIRITVLQPNLMLALDPRESEALPGEGLEALEALSTFPESWGSTAWEDLPVRNLTERERIRLAGAARGQLSAEGFPALGGGLAGIRRWSAAPTPQRPGVAAVVGSDTFDRRRGILQADLLKLPGILQGRVHVLARRRNEEDPDPRWGEPGPRRHSDLVGADLQALLDLRLAREPWDRWRLRAGLAAQGREQNYLLRAYLRNPEHSPRQDWAVLSGRVSLRRETMQAPDIELSLGYERSYRELGDGRHFDILDAYRRPDGNDATVAEGTLWPGDDPATLQDEGHVYNHYRLSVASRWDSRVRWTPLARPRERLRLEASLGLSRLRLFEHRDPVHPQNGLALVRFGYTEDPTRQDSGTALEVPELRLTATWSRLDARGLWRAEAGLLGYRASHEGPGEWTRLPDPDTSAEAFRSALEGPGWTGGPQAALTRSHRVGSGLAWVRTATELRAPPLLALGLDAGLLQRSLYAGRSEVVFGSPRLGPERDWSVQAGFRLPVPRLLPRSLGGASRPWIQTAVYATWTRGAWVQVSEEETGITHVADSGERRLRGLHVDWRTARDPPASGVWMLVSYDLSRLEVRGGAPLEMDLALREPDLPLSSPQVRETSDTFGSPTWAWTGAGFRPHSLDRTHRFAAALLWRTAAAPARAGWRHFLADLSLGIVARWSSGRPYTPISPVPEALAGPAEVQAVGQPHSGRLPDVFRLDVALRKGFRLLEHAGAVKLEILNVTDRRNVLRVYRATGDPRDDGFLASDAGRAMAQEQGPAFVDAYEAALRDPFHFDTGRVVRVSLQLDLTRSR